MRTSRFRAASSQHRFVWLLWLALLLPMAQAAATFHVLSHISGDVSGAADGKQVLHQPHCGLCLTAAAVGGGALPTEPPSQRLSPLSHERPQAVFSGAAPVHHEWAYRSRAPPDSPV